MMAVPPVYAHLPCDCLPGANSRHHWSCPEFELLAALRALFDDARKALFANFCTECGSIDPNCQCWNDE